jgi:hypothetical protein
MSVGIFENVFKIADGLMIVDGKGEFEFFHLIKVRYCRGKTRVCYLSLFIVYRLRFRLRIVIRLSVLSFVFLP